MSQINKVFAHLLRARRTIHALGGVATLALFIFEMIHVLIVKYPSQMAPSLSWICIMPYALGLLTPYIQKRIRHNKRRIASVTGMLWVASFNALALSMIETGMFHSRLFQILLVLSIMSTVREIVSGVERGNGWIYGVVFTNLMLCFPLALDWFYPGSPEQLKELYEKKNMAIVIYYNCIHNNLFVSLGFFILSIRDTKIVSEEFADKIGRLLWTFPQIPLCYAAIWRLSCLRYANIWLIITGMLSGVIIYAQKRGIFVSNLSHKSDKIVPVVPVVETESENKKEESEVKKVVVPSVENTSLENKKEESPRFLGIFLRGLVWDDNHCAFHSLNPSPRYSWGIMMGYWMLGAIFAKAFGYSSKIQQQLHDAAQLLTSGTTITMPFVVTAVATLIVTIVAQVEYYQLTNHGNRRLAVVPLIAMPLLNGIFETFWFLITFDLGVKALRPFTSNNILLFSSGFTVFSVYSGVIHAVMWGAHVLPANYDEPRTGGKRTRRQSERLLFGSVIPMSFMWMAWYHFSQDILLLILCHTYADFVIAYSVHLPAPWYAHDEKKKLH